MLRLVFLRNLAVLGNRRGVLGFVMAKEGGAEEGGALVWGPVWTGSKCLSRASCGATWQLLSFTDTEQNMSISQWVMLVVGALLGPALAIDEYSQLHQNYQAGVDIVLDQLQSHAGVQMHFLFFRSIDKSDVEGGFGARHVSHHFTLKPTTCAKGTTAVTSQTCPFRNDRPMMDCTVCYKLYQGAIDTEPKPYVHCIQKPKLTQAMISTRSNHCRRMYYTRGAPTLLAAVGSAD